MAGVDRKSGEVISPPGIDRALLRIKLQEIGRELNAKAEKRLLVIVDELDREPDSVRDAVSTGLMELFRLHQSRASFGLLFELNQHHLLLQVHARLRRYQGKVDANDVLQEVFFNIYRYPHRFDCTREDAFRVWTATIVRNTVLKCLRSLNRGGRTEVPFEDLSEHPEGRQSSPLGGALERESIHECNRVYLVYLQLYLHFYSQLSDRERRAIHMVEVEERSYREAAAELGIKLENLKMVIFRARRKIHRSMRRVFDGLPPDFRPARDPRVATPAAANKGLQDSVDRVSLGRASKTQGGETHTGGNELANSTGSKKS